VKKRE